MEMSHADTIYGRVLLVKHKIVLNAIKLRNAGEIYIIKWGSYDYFAAKSFDFEGLWR
jgi:hypothetical protein